MAAFVRAQEEGFGYLELDVRLSADGVPVVHHDATLDRTTDGAGRVDAHPAAALVDVRVRGREPIPLLEQVLEALPATRMTVELKSAAVVEPVLAVLGGRYCTRVCLVRTRRAGCRARRAARPRLFTSMGHHGGISCAAACLDVLRPLPRMPSPPVTGLGSSPPL